MKKNLILGILLTVVIAVTSAIAYIGLNSNAPNILPTEKPTLTPSSTATPTPTTSPISSMTPTASQSATPSPTASLQDQFVGSKNSDVYHYPSCSSAQRIKLENQIWFKDSADAQTHGYHACQICHPP